MGAFREESHLLSLTLEFLFRQGGQLICEFGSCVHSGVRRFTAQCNRSGSCDICFREVRFCRIVQ